MGLDLDRLASVVEGWDDDEPAEARDGRYVKDISADQELLVSTYWNLRISLHLSGAFSVDGVEGNILQAEKTHRGFRLRPLQWPKMSIVRGLSLKAKDQLPLRKKAYTSFIPSQQG